MQEIDLRSDALTRPTDEMWAAMRAAKLGWALVGEDPAVNELEAAAAELTGKEAAMFVPTGSMANLLALMARTERGDQVIFEASSHMLWSEEWGFAYICGVVPRPIPGVHGVMDPAAVEAAVQERIFSHRPPTTLLCLENTHNVAGGIPLTAAQTAALATAAHRHGIPTHLDGMRLFNAAVALEQSVRELVEPVDSVTVGLNKGLSAPAGALLCGSRPFIDRCRLHIKRLGGQSLHQAGILAAAGLVALRTMPTRLKEDHQNARALAEGLAAIPGLAVDLDRVRTNIVMVGLHPSGLSAATFTAALAARGVRASSLTDDTIRFVTHRHITPAEVSIVVTCAHAILSNNEQLTADS